MLAVCLVLIVTLHLLAVGIVAAGPAVCVALEWRARRREDAVLDEAGRRLAWMCNGAFWVGAALGAVAVGLLWIAPWPAFFEGIAAVPRRRLYFGLAELAFYIACVWPYARWWGRMPVWPHRLLALLAATNAIYHFPPLFAAITVIGGRPELWKGELEYGQFLAILADPETLARVGHTLLASIMVTGAGLLWIGWRCDDERLRKAAARWGGRVALSAALLQIPMGVAVLLTAPAVSREALLLGDLWAGGLFLAALLGMLALLHALAALALGESDRPALRNAVALTVATVALMVAAGHRARLAPNQTLFSERDMPLETITIRDDQSGAEASLLPGFGFNCYSLRIDPGDGPRELLWSAPDIAEGTAKPSHSGVPILFPFPGRARGTSFTFDGKQFSLEPGDGIGNAIHGFVLDRPWEIVQQEAGRIVGRFQASQQAPEILQRWPGDFALQVAYTLSGASLSADITIENPGPGPLPWGLGLHPYFRVPLSSGAAADDCRVWVPAASYYDLENMLPTGRTLPAEGNRDLSSGRSFGRRQLDDIFTGLVVRDGRVQTRLDEPSTGLALSLEFDQIFSHCVVYNPPHREAICLEPYTCAPGLFGADIPAEQALDVLPPGESRQASFKISLTA